METLAWFLGIAGLLLILAGLIWIFGERYIQRGKITVQTDGSIVPAADDPIATIIAELLKLLRRLFGKGGIQRKYWPGFAMIILGVVLLIGGAAAAAGADDSDGEDEPTPTESVAPTDSADAEAPGE